MHAHAYPLPAEAAPGLLQQRPFRMLSFSRFWSGVAQNALNFALVLLIVRETDLTILSSLLVLALVIPATVAGVASGVAADVFPKRIVAFLGDVARAGVCVLFVQVRTDMGVAGYFFVAIGLSATGQFASSARGAILPAIVPRDDLARANAIGQAVSGAAQVVGLGILTPVMLRLFDDPDWLFLGCAAMFVISGVQALSIGRLRGSARDEVGGSHEGRWWSVGWRYLRSDPYVMHAAVELTLISAALIVLCGLIPRFISDVLGMPVDVGALMLLPAAAGVILGLRLAGYLAHRVPHGLLSSAGFTGFVILLLLVTFAGPEAEFLGGYGMFGILNRIEIGAFDGGGALTLILMFPLGFSYAIVSVAAQTVLNDSVPLHLQGRVLATQAAMSAIVASLPVVAAGALADLVGVTPVMALLALGIGVAALSNLREPRRRAARAAGATP